MQCVPAQFGSSPAMDRRDDAAVRERLDLRQTFNSAASLYDRARPRYPAELFDALVSHAGLQAGDHVLEVGCATAIATRPLAERGLNVTCVELGEDLAQAAREKLAGFSQVQVVCADFEFWAPMRTFDLVMAATAWHWIDLTVRYRLAWEALHPGGHLAFWSAVHVFPDHDDGFFEDLQDVYDRIGEGLPPDTPRIKPGQLPDRLEEIEHSGLFSNAVAMQFDWGTVYSPDSYIELLDTFSNHIAMTQAQRDTLYGAVRKLAVRRPSGESLVIGARSCTSLNESTPRTGYV
jgi:SAM-dependent methyltransferase